MLCTFGGKPQSRVGRWNRITVEVFVIGAAIVKRDQKDKYITGSENGQDQKDQPHSLDKRPKVPQRGAAELLHHGGEHRWREDRSTDSIPEKGATDSRQHEPNHLRASSVMGVMGVMTTTSGEVFTL